MADVRIETEGLREFRRDLKKLQPLVDRELREEIRDAAGPMLAEAKAKARRRTGAYAKSLKIGVTTKGISIYSRHPGASVIHWGGTIEPRGVPIVFDAQPSVVEAVEDGAERLVDEIGDGVERAARRVGWH